jgi:hypothetical protein
MVGLGVWHEYNKHTETVIVIIVKTAGTDIFLKVFI